MKQGTSTRQVEKKENKKASVILGNILLLVHVPKQEDFHRNQVINKNKS